MESERLYQSQLSPENALLLNILEGTSHETGDNFFRLLVRELASVLDTFGALVADYLPDKRQLRPRAYWLGDDWVEPGPYDIAGTPCEGVILSGDLFQIPDRVIQHYPENQFLRDFALVSYTGMAFKNTQGNIIGHLAILDSKPLPDEARFMTLFKLFGTRAAAEMRRIQAEEALRQREERLSKLIEGAMDGIVDFDEHFAVELLNQSARKIFRLAEQTPGGSSVSLQDCFTPDSMDLIRRMLAQLDQRQQSHIWIPLLEGRRADGELFQVEATISHNRGLGHNFNTLIFRDIDHLLRAEQKIQALQHETTFLREELQALREKSRIMGESEALAQALRKVGQVADTDASVLLQGETGTGKELFAQTLHDCSKRQSKAMVVVNCAAIPKELVESEFFGHVKGAFTGATAHRQGRFLHADGGTIFLDEVGELPIDVQAKLLRVLQDGEFAPVGSCKTHKVNVRVIAATNRDLEADVEQGLFRKDLFYRLNVFPIQIPPLRERGRDIVLLANFFAEQTAQRLGKPVRPIAAEYATRLQEYDWPGNVRELQNIIEHAVITANDKYLRPEVGLARSKVLPTQVAVEDQENVVYTAEEMRQLACDNIRRALQATQGVISGKHGAAELLGIKPSTLRSQIQVLGIQTDVFMEPR